jgi:hypothetical protein
VSRTLNDDLLALRDSPYVNVGLGLRCGQDRLLCNEVASATSVRRELGAGNPAEDLRERALARFEAGETIRSIGEARWGSARLAFRMASTPAGRPVRFRPVRSVITTAGAVRGTGRLAAGSLPVGAVHDARADGGAGCVWHQDRSPRGLGVSAGRRPEFQKKSVLPAEQNRPAVARKRRRWKTHQHRIDPGRLVFLDETWVKTNMAPMGSALGSVRTW